MSGCESCAASGSCSGSSCSGGSCGGEKKLPPGMLERYDANVSTADGILVFIETVRSGDGISVHPASAQLIGKASKLESGRIYGVIFGDNELKPLYSEIYSMGVNSLYHVKDGRLARFHPEAYSEAVTSVCERVIPASVLIGSTKRGSEIAPRIAASMGAGFVANCDDLALDGRRIVGIKNTDGKTTRSESNVFPLVATVKENTFPDPKPSEGGKGTVFYWKYGGDNFKEFL